MCEQEVDTSGMSNSGGMGGALPKYRAVPVGGSEVLSDEC